MKAGSSSWVRWITRSYWLSSGLDTSATTQPCLWPSTHRRRPESKQLYKKTTTTKKRLYVYYCFYCCFLAYFVTDDPCVCWFQVYLHIVPDERQLLGSGPAVWDPPKCDTCQHRGSGQHGGVRLSDWAVPQLSQQRQENKRKLARMSPLQRPTNECDECETVSLSNDDVSHIIKLSLNCDGRFIPVIILQPQAGIHCCALPTLCQRAPALFRN